MVRMSDLARGTGQVPPPSAPPARPKAEEDVKKPACRVAAPAPRARAERAGPGHRRPRRPPGRPPRRSRGMRAPSRS